MGRVSMPQGRGSQMHNRRDYDSIGRDMPSNIDKEKTAENVTLIDRDIKEVYHELFDEAVKRYNEKQTRAERKIDDYYDKVSKSKNGEKLFYEDVIQWGSKEDFEKDPQLREKAKTALLQYFHDFTERNPNMKVVGAYIHMDEASPHLHLDYVPVAHGYKTGMETRTGMDRALKELGFGSENNSRRNNSVKLWKENEREAFKEICRELGLDVEQERRARGSLSVDEYKEAKQKMMGELEAERDSLKQELVSLERSNELNKSLVAKSRGVLESMLEEAEGTRGLIEESKEQLAHIDDQVEKASRRLEKLNKLERKLEVTEPDIYTASVGGMLNKRDVTVIEGYSPQEVARVFQRANFRGEIAKTLNEANTRSQGIVQKAHEQAQAELENARQQIAWANQMLQGEAERKRKLDVYEKTLREKNAALAAENEKLLSDNNRLLQVRADLDKARGELSSCRDEVKAEREKIKSLMNMTSELELNPEAAKKLLNDSIVDTLTNKVSFLTCQRLEREGLLNKQAEVAYMEINTRSICAHIRDEFENFIERAKEHMLEIAERSNNFIYSLHHGR